MSKIYIHPTAEVSKDAVIGEGTKIWHHVHVRENVRIGANTTISKNVYVDQGVSIGNRVKIQNGVSVYKGVEIEDEVFVGPNATFTNDLRPRAFDNQWIVTPTILRKGASVGANATILCGITLGEYCMISAGAVITVDALPYGLYIGNPARLKGFVSRFGHEMRFLSESSGIWNYECPESGEKLEIRFNSSQTK